MLKKSAPTVIDSILKIGSLLGFIKIFSTAIGYSHRRLFVRDLKNKFGNDKDAKYEGIQSEASVLVKLELI